MKKNWLRLALHLFIDFLFRLYNKHKLRMVDENGGNKDINDLIGRWVPPKKKGLISIVLPTFNPKKEYLRAAILSCLRQTYDNLELIVVDDGSASPLRKYCTQFNDRRIKYLRHRTNKGLAAALNSGFRKARGDYLTWTSDDNLFAAEAFESMIGFLEAKIVDMVYADYYLITPKNHILRSVLNQPPEYLKIANCVGFCFLYKRSVYEKIGDYIETESFRYVEDYEYWWRVAHQFKVKKLTRCLYFVRVHPDSLSYRYPLKTYLKTLQLYSTRVT